MDYYMTAQGWLRADERERLYQLAKDVPADGMMLNIGIEFGASMVCLREGSRKALLIGLDIDVSVIQPETKKFLAQFDTVIDEINSQEFLGMIRSFDIIFVDGDHSYDGVKADIALFAPMVKPGGVIAFHDCHAWSDPSVPASDSWVEGVNRAVEEWYQSSLGTNWEELPGAGTMRIFRKGD